MEAGLSLEPLLILVAALARDLQADFLPFMPRLAAALTELTEQGTPVLMAALCPSQDAGGFPDKLDLHAAGQDF